MNRIMDIENVVKQHSTLKLLNNIEDVSMFIYNKTSIYPKYITHYHLEIEDELILQNCRIIHTKKI